MRDPVLGVPVFWVQQNLYRVVCAATAVLVYSSRICRNRVIAYRCGSTRSRLPPMASSVPTRGVLVTGSATVAIAMGMLTGTFGGILRDVLAREPSVLMRQEIYVALAMTDALAFGWTLPAYRSRPGRPPEDLR